MEGEQVRFPTKEEIEANVLSTAFTNGATAMRDKCVEKVRAMGEQWRQEASKAGRMFSDKTAIATKIATELESLTFEPPVEKL